ncbi:hypothetical protein QN277_010440 [Acacia crassicarpa]|uniref:Uncharacterized protein n=1 Tax=Acacia crassicarpa TaxID=499986 RepID=A0AAE1IQW0_9FABA|nr:hypothetical protein QN277_010440 [Acacia crassicarpa]
MVFIFLGTDGISMRKLSKVQMNNIALTLVVIFYGNFSFVLRQLFNMRLERRTHHFPSKGCGCYFWLLLIIVLYGPHPVKNLVGHIALWHLFYEELHGVFILQFPWTMAYELCDARCVFSPI